MDAFDSFILSVTKKLDNFVGMILKKSLPMATFKKVLIRIKPTTLPCKNILCVLGASIPFKHNSH